MSSTKLVTENANKLFSYIRRTYKPEMNKPFQVSFTKHELESLRLQFNEIINAIEELKKGGYIRWETLNQNETKVTILKLIPMRPR